MLKPAATWNLILCQRTLCLPPAPGSSTPQEGEGVHGDWKRKCPRASSHWSLFPKAGVTGHGGRLTPFSRSSPKSQATNLGELERKLIKYTSCVSTATGVRLKPPPPAANDQVQISRTKQSGALLPSWNRLQDPVVSLGLAGQGFVFRKKLNCLETALKEQGWGQGVHHYIALIPDIAPPPWLCGNTCHAPARGLSP